VQEVAAASSTRTVTAREVMKKAQQRTSLKRESLMVEKELMYLMSMLMSRTSKLSLVDLLQR